MSKIQWTEKTWNPIIGCSKISEGCKNCYAEKMAVRLANMENTYHYQAVTCRCAHAIPSGWNGKTYFAQDQLEKPLKRKKPTKYFVCSMGDLFHESVPFEWIDKVFEVISKSPQHTFQILTKRPDIMAEYYKERRYEHFHNVWLGVTAENEEEADKRIPVLLKIQAKVRFVSLEPILEPINLTHYYFPYRLIKNVPVESRTRWLDLLDQVIVGTESGQHRRPAEQFWIEDIVDQCKDFNIPVFVKQIEGKKGVIKDINQFPEHLKFQEYPV